MGFGKGGTELTIGRAGSGIREKSQHKTSVHTSACYRTHSGSPCTLLAGQRDCANHYSLGYGGRVRPCFLAALLRLAV